MSNLISGNHKHLTPEDRRFIEHSLNIREIAKYLCKDPSTISKEVWRHQTIKKVSKNQLWGYNKIRGEDDCAVDLPILMISWKTFICLLCMLTPFFTVKGIT